MVPYAFVNCAFVMQKNTVAARLALLDEIKKEKSADEETMAEKMKQVFTSIQDFCCHLLRFLYS